VLDRAVSFDRGVVGASREGVRYMLSYRWHLGLLLALGALSACGEKAEKPAGQTGTQSEPGETTQAATADQAAPTGPIAKVNGTELPRGEFDQKYAKMTKAFTTRKKEIPDNLARRYKESILKQLIEKELLRQKIEAEKIAVDQPELEKEFEDYKKMFRTDENFQTFMQQKETVQQ
jgi:hypothetical protein